MEAIIFLSIIITLFSIFVSSPACIGILILTAIASLMLAIIYKSKQEIQEVLRNGATNKNRVLEI